MRQEEILYMFPQAMRGKWAQAAAQADSLQEIRMRVNPMAALHCQKSLAYLIRKRIDRILTQMF